MKRIVIGSTLLILVAAANLVSGEAENLTGLKQTAIVVEELNQDARAVGITEDALESQVLACNPANGLLAYLCERYPLEARTRLHGNGGTACSTPAASSGGVS